MRSYHVSKSTSTATATATSTSAATTVTALGDSRPELAIEQQQQGSFVGFSTTVHTPESTYILAADRYVELRELAEICSSRVHVDPFEALATYQTASYDDDVQERSASSLSLSDEPFLSSEPSQPTNDANSIMENAEPKPRSRENPADQDSDSIEKRVMFSSDKIRPFKCSYEGCGKTYMTKQGMCRHFVSHIGDSQFRCYTGDCTGIIRYRDKEALAKHIYTTHTKEKPHRCDICNKRFARTDHLLNHRRRLHSARDVQKQPQNSDSTDNWIIYCSDEKRPFQCGYEDCGKKYTAKQALQKHFISHIGDSQFRCYTGDCNGATRYCDRQALARHIHKKHTLERPFTCEICNNRFVRLDHLKDHQQHIHFIEREQTTKKEQKSPPKQKRK